MPHQPDSVLGENMDAAGAVKTEERNHEIHETHERERREEAIFDREMMGQKNGNTGKK
jgi:hypothetical protein